MVQIKKCIVTINSGIMWTICCNVCNVDSSSGILPFVCRRHLCLAPTYTSLCRGLEYLPKVGICIISTRRIFDFRDRLSGNTALCLKNISKNERHLHLVEFIFTKLSQNVCLVNMPPNLVHR